MRFFEDIVPKLEHQKPLTLLLGFAAFLLVVVGDYVTPEELTFSVFYLVPIGFFVWFFSRRSAWIVAIASALIWPWEHVVRSDFDYFRTFILYWEIAVRLGFYAVFIVSLTTIKRYLSQVQKVNGELRSALAEVKQLRGLLPICSSCKKIRDDSEQWVVLEKYIQTHSDATFSHGLCPDCMKIIYPDYYNSLTKGEDA
jgi:hypothetical protein